ncbi:hypothetical protein MRX96_018403 [Rhipicephalus microplus]
MVVFSYTVFLAYDLYCNRMLCIPESEQDLKEIVSRKRVRVRPLIEDSDQASDGDSNVAPSKEQDKPSESRERLLKILQKKEKSCEGLTLTGG